MENKNDIEKVRFISLTFWKTIKKLCFKFRGFKLDIKLSKNKPTKYLKNIYKGIMFGSNKGMVGNMNGFKIFESKNK